MDMPRDCSTALATLALALALQCARVILCVEVQVVLVSPVICIWG
jgi:hypothetical protein